MKGTVYTGIVYLPKHPQADMHGLLRCAVRTERGMSHLAAILRVYDIPFSPMLFNWGIWCLSESVVEQTATELYYGRALVCPLWCQYLEPGKYKPISDVLKPGATLNPGAAQGIEDPAIFRNTGRHLYIAGEDGRRCRVCHQLRDENPRHVRPIVPPLAPQRPDSVKLESTETK